MACSGGIDRVIQAIRAFGIKANHQEDELDKKQNTEDDGDKPKHLVR